MLCGPIMSYLSKLSMFTGQESLHEVMACLSEVVGNLYDSPSCKALVALLSIC